MLAVLAFLVAAALASTLPNQPPSSHRQLAKRTFNLQCESVPLSEISTDTEVLSFLSLESLCETSPEGLQLTCDGPRPFMPGWRSRAMLLTAAPTRVRQFYRMCTRFCSCIDDGVTSPSSIETATTATLTTVSATTHSATATATSTGRCRSGPMELLFAEDDSWYRPGEQCSCSAAWYGHPALDDCISAIAQLPDYNGRYEFLGPGVESNGGGRDRDGCVVQSPPIRGPIIKTHRTCTVALTHQHADEYLSMELYEVRQAWTALFDKCVAGQGIGGIMMPLNWWSLGLMGDVPVITLSGPNSPFNQALKLRYLCRAHPDGSAVCPTMEESWQASSSAQSTLDVSDSSPTTSIEAAGAGKQACSGTCYDPDDCDINSDCLCASKRDLPLSSSWGQHSCMHVAGAAIALSSTLMKPHGLCHGRCALEDDGTLLVGALPGASSNTSSTGMTNQTMMKMPPWSVNSGPPPRPPQGEGASQLNTSASSIVAPLPTNAATLNINNNSESNDMPQESNDTFTSLPTLQKQMQNQMRAGSDSGSSSEIICPCNCTYVSPACCLSRWVWAEDDASMQVEMDPRPANSSLCCDEQTGKWVSSESAGGACHGSAGTRTAVAAAAATTTTTGGDGDDASGEEQDQSFIRGGGFVPLGSAAASNASSGGGVVPPSTTRTTMLAEGSLEP